MVTGNAWRPSALTEVIWKCVPPQGPHKYELSPPRRGPGKVLKLRCGKPRHRRKTLRGS